MSLLQKIYGFRDETAKMKYFVGSYGSPVFDTWNLATLNFQTREEAEDAYSRTRYIYDDITANQTWEGITSQGGRPEDDQFSFRHHMWVDENDDGFTLCVSFDNRKQTRDFIESASKKLNGALFGFDDFKVEDSKSDRLNRHMMATHSVEVDFVYDDYNDVAKTTFDEVANDRKFEPALFTSVINRSDLGVKRLKARFMSEADAQSFKARCSIIGIFASRTPLIREFPAAKQDQPKRPVMA